MNTNSSQLHSGMPTVPSQDKMLIIQNSEIYRYYYERLVNLALSQFEWHNLPPGVDRYYLEKMLLFNGTAAIYNPEGTDIWLGTSYVQRETKYGMFDVYGYPRDIYGIPAGGYTVMRQIPVTPGKFKIIYDNMTLGSLLPKMELYAKQMWEVHDAFRANVEHQLNPWIVAAPSKMKTTVQNFFNRYLGHQRVIQVMNGFKPGDMEVMDERVPFIGPEMLDCLRRLWAEALSMLGITSDVSKKERYVRDELTMVRQEDIISLNSRLMNRVEACNYLNERFGFDMSVNLSSNDIQFRPYGSGEGDNDGQLYNRNDDPADEPAGETGELEED